MRPRWRPSGKATGTGSSTASAGRLYGVVYPRDTWWNRLGVSLVNLGCGVRRNPFRVFLHDPATVEEVIQRSGLRRRFYRTTRLWQVIIYAR